MFIISKHISDAAKNVLQKQVASSAIERETNELKCLLFPKALIRKDDVFYSEGLDWIFGNGTWAYQGKFGKESLKILLKDIEKGTLQEGRLRGQYILLVSLQGKLALFTDSSGLLNIYFDHAGTIASSFLAVLRNSQKKVKLNHLAALEVLSTGSLISPDTLVEEVQRWHPRYDRVITSGLKVNVVDHSLLSYFPAYKSRRQALDTQVELAEEYFQSFRLLSDSAETDIGVTGGLDSRLLLGFALQFWNRTNLNIYTNARTKSGAGRIVDEPIALKVAEAAGLPLKFGWMRHPTDLSPEELGDVIDSAYHFADGHVRMHIQFFEEYNTSAFKRRVLSGSTFNMSGIGGEQYRNQERLFGTFSLEKFLLHKVIKPVSGEALGKHFNPVLRHLQTKVKTRTGISQEQWGLAEAKRYLNEVINGERLGARNNLENKLNWFLSPFADAKLSTFAYGIYPYLNFSPDFQVEMLKRVAPALASVPLDYGFTPDSGVPYSYKFFNFVKGIVPWWLFYITRIKPQLNRRYPLFEQMSSIPFVLQLARILEYNFPQVNVSMLLQRPDMMPVALNLAYFMFCEAEHGTLIIDT